MHKVKSSFFTDILVKCATKIIGNIILSVGESTCTTETAHNGTALAANAGLDLLAVNGTMASAQCVTGFKNSYFQLRLELHQFVGRKNSSGAGTNNDQVVIHGNSSLDTASTLYALRKDIKIY